MHTAAFDFAVPTQYHAQRGAPNAEKNIPFPHFFVHYYCGK